MDFRSDQAPAGERPPAVSGTFYPADAVELQHTVRDLLAAAPAAGIGRIRAVIAPHAGYIYSGPVAASAFARLRALKGRILRVVLIGPAHFVPIRGLAAPAANAFLTPIGAMPLDKAAIREIAALPQVTIDDGPHAPEHALEVELPFLQEVLGLVRIIPLVVGSADADTVADILDRLWDEWTLIVVSTNLSHYHDYETARRLDAVTAEAIERCDSDAIGPGDACGSVAVGGLLIAAGRRGLSVERLDLRNSGDTAGDRRRVVGYGAWAFSED